MRQFALNVFTGADKILGVVVVLFNPGRYRENIGVENDVFRRETHLFGQNFISPAADFDFAFAGVGLADFIKRHYHHRRAIATYQFRMVNKGVHALFHGDGVNNAFTLNALQTLFNDIPL